MNQQHHQFASSALYTLLAAVIAICGAALVPMLYSDAAGDAVAAEPCDLVNEAIWDVYEQ